MTPYLNLKKRPALVTLSLLCAFILLALSSRTTTPAGAQTSSGDLKGKSRNVLLIPNNTVDAGEIHFKPDSDHDGMPDDDENANGTDPNNPADADTDNDNDGLTNGDEVAGGSGVNNPDTDGDGISDGEEARLGYNPTDPNSTPPINTVVVSIQVTPSPLDLSINSLLGPQPGHLHVTGILNTGATVDLTNAPDITYQSLNPSVALIDDFGTAAGISLGTTSIVVTKTSESLTATVPVSVTSYTPRGLASISIPGYANGVATQGTYAYVAAGASGLIVVDVSNYKIPRLVGTLNTPGNAEDVKVSGNLAYVADGTAGLLVVSVADKAHPSLLGSADTTGDAQDIALAGTNVYVADGDAGLEVINVADPAHPAVVGSFDTAGTSRGVDVSGGLAVVADDFPQPSLYVFSVAQPQSPALAGQLLLNAGAKDVVVSAGYAYVPENFNGMQVVGLANPASPQAAANFNNFAVRGLALSGTYAFVNYTQFFTNGPPVIAVNDPTRPNWRGGIDFSFLSGGITGVAVAADQQYIYATTIESDTPLVDNGSTGRSTFMIGRYQPRYDHAGVAPNVSIVSPQEGQSVLVGNTLFITADATDDVEVDRVQFRVNGSVIATDLTFPYEAAYTVPASGGTLAVTATATDLGGNAKTTAPVNVTGVPKPPPAVSIVSPAEGATLIQGQTVNLIAQVTDPSNVRRVVFNVNGTDLPADTSAPFQKTYTVPANVNTLTITATATFFDSTPAASATRTVNIVPPDPTTVTGHVIDFAGRPVAGAAVSVFGEFFAQSASDGTFSVAGVPTSRGAIAASATATVEGREVGGASSPAAPVPGGTTNVGNVLVQDAHYETEIGSLVTFSGTRFDDVSAAVQLPFAFQYYGTTYTQVFVGSNGYLTFGSGDTSFNETEANFANGRPRIAPLYDDWFPDQTADHGVYANMQLPGRAVFTWRGVWHATNHSNPEVNNKADFQVIIFADGRIQFGYRDVQTLGGLAGITPGGTPRQLPFNFTATPTYSFTFGQDTALFERFRGIGPAPFDLEHSFITFVPQSFGGYEVKFQHEPQTIVAGRLTDTSGNPVGGATVALMGRSVVSEADGSFHIERVSAAEGPISAKAIWVAPDGRFLQAQSALTQPVAGSTTDLGTLLMGSRGQAFETDLGTPIAHAAGSFPKTAFQLPFLFRFYGQSFYGQTFDRVYVNPTGHLTLTNLCVKAGCNDRFTLTTNGINDVIFAFSNSPIISPLLSDLDPGNTGQVFVKSSPDEWVMTFLNVQRQGQPGTNTFQVVLRPDGTIRFAYDGISNTYGHVGLSPGIFWGMSENSYSVDWSATYAARMENAYPFFEDFTGELAPAAQRYFDLDHQVMVFYPNDAGGYEVVRQKINHTPQSKILFESGLEGDWDIFSLDGDGRNLVNLTNHGGDDYDATFSPDRTKIAFDSYRDDPTGSNEEVYVMNADGTGVVNLTNSPDSDDYYPHWSPDGSKILFYSNRNGDYEIFVMNADGGNQHSLTGYSGDSTPIWSPDGSKILIESNREGPWRLYLLDSDGSNPRPLEGAGNFGGNPDAFADWSPDGSKVAFHSYRNGEGHVFVVNVDGTGLVDLGQGLVPEWSPDGSKILFFNGGFRVMNADGTNITQVSPAGSFIADWSPDGSQVMYIGNYADNSATLWIVNSNGTNPRLLVDKHALVYLDDWKVVP